MQSIYNISLAHREEGFDYISICRACRIYRYLFPGRFSSIQQRRGSTGWCWYLALMPCLVGFIFHRLLWHPEMKTYQHEQEWQYWPGLTVKKWGGIKNWSESRPTIQVHRGRGIPLGWILHALKSLGRILNKSSLVTSAWYGGFLALLYSYFSTISNIFERANVLGQLGEWGFFRNSMTGY